jgi:hypothetical protein
MATSATLRPWISYRENCCFPAEPNAVLFGPVSSLPIGDRCAGHFRNAPRTG